MQSFHTNSINRWKQSYPQKLDVSYVNRISAIPIKYLSSETSGTHEHIKYLGYGTLPYPEID